MKIAIVLRKDLKMPAGKAIAQAIHAVHGLEYKEGCAVVALQAESEEQLNYLVDKYNGHKVIDAGRTVFREQTLTCAAFICDDNAFEDLRLY